MIGTNGTLAINNCLKLSMSSFAFQSDLGIYHNLTLLVVPPPQLPPSKQEKQQGDNLQIMGRIGKLLKRALSFENFLKTQYNTSKSETFPL